MNSPVIQQLLGEPSGCLQGKIAIRDYWRKALAASPELSFELLHILCGESSVTLVYHGVSAEVFELNAQGQVQRAMAHY